MSCLTNFVGISEACTPVASKSGMYIEDFEGISVKSISAIEGGKYLTVQNLVNAKLRIVEQKMSERISGLVDNLTIYEALDTLISQSFGTSFLAQEDGNPGLRIEKSTTAFSKIFIPYLYFKSNTPVTALQITVSDGVNSEVFTLDALAGEEVAIECGFSTTQRKVDITYSSDTTPSDPGVAPFTQPINYGFNFLSRPIPGCCEPCSEFLRIRGLDFDGTEVSRYMGVRADIQLLCDRDAIVCFIAPKYKLIVFYYLIIEILNEWIASDRFNFLAMNSKDWAKEKVNELNGRIDRLWFDNSDGIKQAIVNSEPKCFNCTGYRYYEPIP